MLKSFIYFIRLIFNQKELIISMAKREVANHYVGSLLGFIWTFVNPIVMILVFWFVFEVGFKIKTESDVPFVVWLTAGMAIWFAFADIISGSTGVIVENGNLIKKTLFPSQILPIIKIVSCLITHTVFLIILIALILLQGMPFNFYYFQLFLGVQSSIRRCHVRSNRFLGDSHILEYWHYARKYTKYTEAQSVSIHCTRLS